MQTNYPLIVVALLLFVITGCTDVSNPVGPDTALQFTEAAPNHSNVLNNVKSDDDKMPGNGAALVAEGKFAFREMTKQEPVGADTRSPADGELNVIGFSVRQEMGTKQTSTGYVEFQDGDGPDFSVHVQEVQMHDNGSVSFNGPIQGSDVKSGTWFFARASDGGDTSDSFAYSVGPGPDEPADEAFTTVIITEGGLTIYQIAF